MMKWSMRFSFETLSRKKAEFAIKVERTIQLFCHSCIIFIMTSSNSLDHGGPPTKLINIVERLLHNLAAQAVDFLYIRKLLRTETGNLPGLEHTVEEQVGHPMLLPVMQHCL